MWFGGEYIREIHKYLSLQIYITILYFLGSILVFETYKISRTMLLFMYFRVLSHVAV